MRISLTAALLAGLTLFAAPAAHASGGLWCNVDDANLKLDVESGVTHGMGSPFFSFKAAGELKGKDVATDFQKLTLDDKLVHSWLDGDEVRLLFYTERTDGEFGSVQITIETVMAADEEGYEGTYQVSYFEGTRQKGEEDGFRRFEGKLTCGVE